MSFLKISTATLCTLVFAAHAFAADSSVQKLENNRVGVPALQQRALPISVKQRLAQQAQNKQLQNKLQTTSPVTVSSEDKVAPVKPASEKSGAIKTAPGKVTDPSNNMGKAETEKKPEPPKSLLTFKDVPVEPVQQEPVKKRKKSKKQQQQQIPTEKRAFFAGVMLPQNYKEISIFGENELDAARAAAYIRQNNPSVKLACSVEELVDLYWSEAAREGVRGDLALCQAITETGFFRYGGDVRHNQNNFCGLGTTGKGVRGASFKTPQLGVRAHIQHLLAYSRDKRPSTTIVDPRYTMANNLRRSKGFVDKWSGLNGTWAMGSEYCEKIMSHYSRMQTASALPKIQETKPRENGKLTMKDRVAQYKKQSK